jgi:hypothetical protein
MLWVAPFRAMGSLIFRPTGRHLDEMRALKIIAGVVCLLAGLYFALFAWMAAVNPFYRPALWFRFIPAGFAAGIFFFGVLLLLRQNKPLSGRFRWTMEAFLCLLVSSATFLDLHIRQERKSLQEQARAFLANPIPKSVIPNSEGYIGYEFFGTNNYEAERQIMGGSQPLIKRYATTGRIRWSARIQGQFAITGEHLNFPNSDDVERTNQEVRVWLAERNAILSEEWRMGYWQWIEDTIEMKSKIPEIEEEDYHPSQTTNGISR